METSLIRWADFSGGLNEGVSPTQILDNQLHFLLNWYPFGPRLKRRGGHIRISNSGAAAERLTSIARFQPDADNWYLMAGGLSAVYRLASGAMIPIPVTDGQVYTSQPYPWTHVQRRGVMYHARKNTGTMKRSLHDFMQDAGIAAPSSACTIADGGAGSMEAGDRVVIVTFRNSDTDAESNESPVSNTLTLGANRQITVTSAPVSTNGQVNQRRFWVTLPNAQEEYFLLGTIDDNFTTTATFNVTQDDLGDQFVPENAVPPSNIELISWWDKAQRMVATDGVDVYLSALDMPESWPEDLLFTVNPEDGNRVSALYADGARFIIGKPNIIFYLSGSGAIPTKEILTEEHGVIAHESMKSAEGTLLWLSPDRNIYAAGPGQRPQSISTIRVRETLDLIPDAMLQYATAVVDPATSSYVISIGQDDSETENQVMLAYNYKNDAWTKYEFPSNAPAAVHRTFDDNGKERIYCSFYDGHVHKLFEGNTDNGTPISCGAVPKAISKGGFLMGVRRIGLDCESIPENITLEVFNNQDEGSPAATREVYLNTDERHKLFNVSSLGTPASQVMVWLTYAGLTDLTIDGVDAELVTLQRRVKVI